MNPGVIDGAAEIGKAAIDAMRSACVAPAKGSLPVSASNTITPIENKSLRASTGLPCACSGDM